MNLDWKASWRSTARAQQLAGPPVDGQLGLQLGDPALGGTKLRPLGRRQPRLKASVDPVLPQPGVDRLVADLQVEGHLDTLRPEATRSSTLRRNSGGYPRRPTAPPQGVRWHEDPTIGLHETRGTPLGLLDANEVRVRRPAAHKALRQRFVSGKARANTVKALVITDPPGGCCCAGAPARDLRTI